MKLFTRFVFLFCFFSFGFANTAPHTSAQPLPHFQASLQQEGFVPMKLATPQKPTKITKKPNPAFSFTIYSGSLKSNIERLAHQFNWKHVVWRPRVDYKWTGKVTIQGNSLNSILISILKKYPLQAVLYQGNHVLAIEPRKFS